MNRADRSLTSQSHIDEARSRFIVNVASQVGYLVINTAIMLWYIPFLIGHLGVAAYGMASLANSLVAYSVIISMGVEVTVNRFLAIDINGGNDVAANRTFNAALALSLLACAILLLPTGLVTYFFPTLFNVPTGLEVATQFLFASACISTLATIVSGNFGVASVIMHRFDLRNAVRMLASIVRVGYVVICFFIWDPSLWYVSAGLIVAAAVGLVGDVLVWRRLTPQLQIQRKEFDASQFRALFSLGGWETINQLGFLLLTQVNLVIVNAMFGAEMTGRFGALIPFTSLIFTMTAAVSEVARPTILARYAMGDISGIQKIASHSVKLLNIGLALPVGLLCGFGGPLLNLWLGKDFADLDFLLTLLAGHLTLNSGVLPLIYVIMAYNRVKAEALVTLLLGVANIFLAVALARWTDLGAAGVAAATAIIWTIRNVGVLTCYSAMLMGMRWWAFYPALAIGAVATLTVALAGRFVSQTWWPNSLLELGTWGAAISLIYIGVAYAIFLDSADRALLWSLLSRSHRNQAEQRQD